MKDLSPNIIMTTLPANSTFLPVLDDLLSPDFRPVLLPVQTPQTPIEPSYGGTVSTTGAKVNFGETHAPSPQCGDFVGKTRSDSGYDRGKVSKNESQEAAVKIQRWWKSRRGKSRMGNGTYDLNAERAKHSIRHSRTEDHIRFLEGEVSRLKGALSSERKLRSLQLEAIRSLWSQVQKFSTSASIDLANSTSSSLMTQSVPNGLPNQRIHSSPAKESGIMSMSLNSALDQQKLSVNSPCKNVSTPKSPLSCSCSKEIQILRDSLTMEMAQLRATIDQLRVKNIIEVGSGNGSGSSNGNGSGDENTRISQQKRPLSLNLIGVTNKEKSEKGDTQSGDNNSKQPEGKEITGYADQMASKLLEDAVETEPMD